MCRLQAYQSGSPVRKSRSAVRQVQTMELSLLMLSSLLWLVQQGRQLVAVRTQGGQVDPSVVQYHLCSRLQLHAGPWQCCHSRSWTRHDRQAYYSLCGRHDRPLAGSDLSEVSVLHDCTFGHCGLPAGCGCGMPWWEGRPRPAIVAASARIRLWLSPSAR